MKPIYPVEVLQKAGRIRLFICDVDGVLTDGRILLGEESSIAYQAFHVQDGLGLKQLKHNGIEIAIISSRQSEAVAKRANELGVCHIYQGVLDKLTAYLQLLQTISLTDIEVAYCGDDVPDLPVMQRAGLSVAVSNAHWKVKEIATWQTTRGGGEGAVREVCDLLLFSQSKS